MTTVIPITRTSCRTC